MGKTRRPITPRENPYYNPENVGLVKIAETDAGASYEFDIIAVWKDAKSRNFWWAWGSGCSCPIPFDGVELQPLTALKQLTEHRATESDWISRPDWGEFMDTVRTAMREAR